jgi:protease-4
MRQIEMIKQGFYAAVKAGRGDRLKAGPDVVLSGQLWPGSEALQLGLVDALGTQSDAVAKAASMAHVSNYVVADLYEKAGLVAPPTFYGFFAESADGTPLPYPKEAGIYLLYVPPLSAEQK